MQCQQFEQLLIEQDDGSLSKSALVHIEECLACRSLTSDLHAIHDLALEIGSEGMTPPERVWLSLRNQLESENLIHETQAASRPVQAGWWLAFQRPVFAGAYLALIIVVSVIAGYEGSARQEAFHPQFEIQSAVVSTPPTKGTFDEESFKPGIDLIEHLPKRDAAVTDSIRRNLGIVDNFISMCEKNVREQPDNQLAREYLYGAYQQKAELLATAMNRSMSGGLQ